MREGGHLIAWACRALCFATRRALSETHRGHGYASSTCSAGAHHAAHVGGDDHQILVAVARLDIRRHHGRGEKVVGRDVEEALDLACVQVHRQHAVCACLPDEEHEIGALFSAYSLARHGCRVTYLGARLPFEALEQAAEALRPNLLCLSVARPDLLREQRARLMTIARRVPAGLRLVLGGGGVQAEDAELEALGVIVVRAGGPRLVELLG